MRQVPAGWDGFDHAYDFAVIAFHGRGASCTASTYQVGYFIPQTVSSGLTGIPGIVTGYPDKPNAEAAGTWTVPEMFTHLDTGGYTSTWPAYPTQIWHYNDASEGQSGAPYWTNLSGGARVRGIHWGFDPDYTPTNAARRWDSTLDTLVSSYGGI